MWKTGVVDAVLDGILSATERVGKRAASLVSSAGGLYGTVFVRAGLEGDTMQRAVGEWADEDQTKCRRRWVRV
ncbi:hypothetical protein GCM10017744_100480 [Streptomyces antimycoticus]|uniref:Uncharacterized protein n=1 Tax=Streptomyces antimycoticus TaxID=68175 RepID=A0A4D4K133_9ACTN|nr:hypothetical protein SANT12839_012880 [Streptomyces antimycoticus]